MLHTPPHPIELPKDPLALFETSPRTPFSGEFEGKGLVIWNVMEVVVVILVCSWLFFWFKAKGDAFLRSWPKRYSGNRNLPLI